MAQAQSPIRLVPLLCAACQSPVPAQPDEVAWVCETCGKGLLLNPTPGPNEPATRLLDVFFSDAVKPGAQGRPFWVSPGQVTITSRQTYEGNEGRDAESFWAAPRLFYIPAWELALEPLVEQGVALLRSAQKIQPGGRVPFLPVVSPPGDVRALAEFMVINIEADRRDKMKTLTFDLKLQPPQLWILP